MPLTDSDINKIVSAIEDRLAVHFSDRAVSNPNAWLNSGISTRLELDRQRDLKAQTAELQAEAD